MPKLTIVVLVAALSGVPATAVVCDVLLCDDGTASAAQGCHEHAGSSAGVVVAEATNGCTHLADSLPFVTPSLRPPPAAALHAVADAAPVPPPPDAAGPARAAARAAPSSAPVPIPLVLRI